MRCKCGKTIEPGFELTGKCEDCYANVCGELIQDDYGSDKDGAPKNVLNRYIDDLELGNRTTAILFSMGIVLIGDLVKKTASQIMRKRQIGEKTLAIINTQLQKLGLALKQ